MNSRAWVFASAVGGAVTFALSAEAGGFNFGSFMFGTGGTRWVPECGATEVLTEIKDTAGRSRWVCIAKQAADDKKQPADSTAQTADSEAKAPDSIAQAVADSGTLAADSMAKAAADSATQAAGRVTQATSRMAQAVDSGARADSHVGGDVRSAELEGPTSPSPQLSAANDPQVHGKFLMVGD